jgi:hypothetical protein
MSELTVPTIVTDDHPDRLQAADLFIDTARMYTDAMYDLLIDGDAALETSRSRGVDVASLSLHKLLDATKEGMFITYDPATQEAIENSPTYQATEQEAAEVVRQRSSDPRVRRAAREKVARMGLSIFLSRLFDGIPAQRTSSENNEETV